MYHTTVKIYLTYKIHKVLKTHLTKCVFSCAFKIVERENDLPHVAHRNGRSPVD